MSSRNGWQLFARWNNKIALGWWRQARMQWRAGGWVICMECGSGRGWRGAASVVCTLQLVPVLKLCNVRTCAPVQRGSD
jgi:hypothetical protein